MDRRSLGVVAIILIALMAIVAAAGLDDLPRAQRRAIEAAPAQLASGRAQFERERAWIENTAKSEPDLFRDKAAVWQTRLDQNRFKLDSAAALLPGLAALAKANRRSDADEAREALAKFDSLRQAPNSDLAGIKSEAERWLGYKRELPQRLEAAEASHKALEAFSLAAATPVVQKALVDWPSKKADLETRLDGLKIIQKQGEEAWATAGPLAAAARSGRTAGFDYATFFASADRLDSTLAQLKQGAASADALAGQLYTGWDKVLVDVDEDGPREKVRYVRTRYPDATLANGQTSSEEKWVDVDRFAVREAERSQGMVVERKAAGKYDSEAERVIQPPAYAYVAPPGQSNAYGSWTNGVWHWLPQYLLLSQLLHATRGPVTYDDFNAYSSARRRGEIFYGRNDEYRPRWRSRSSDSTPYSTGGPSARGWWKERAKPRFSEGGSFGGSRYTSRGTYSGSRFQSRGGFGSLGSRSYSRGFGRSFGRGRR